jgi:hypothetical protein
MAGLTTEDTILTTTNLTTGHRIKTNIRDDEVGYVKFTYFGHAYTTVGIIDTE